MSSHSPVFSRSVFGVFWLLMMSMSWPSTSGMYGFVSAPSFMLISPMAQVALLHTEMNSGLRLLPRMGRKSDMYGWTCWKQALVKSPRSANDD